MAGREGIPLEQLVKQPFLLTEKGMSYRRLLDEQLAARSLEIQPVFVSGNADLICNLVEQNAGIALLPDYATRPYVEKGTVRQDTDEKAGEVHAENETPTCESE